MSERDKPSSETGGRQPRGLGGDSGSEDWRRYGSANPGTAGPRARAESGLGETDEAGHPPDDQYHAYRLEGSRSGSRTAAELALAGRHRRTSNLIGVGAAVAVIAAAALAFNIQASTISPPPVASRAALRSLSSSSSTIPSATSPGPFKSTLIGQVSVTIRLPLSVTIPDRGLDPDNGIAMYLTGPTGGVAIDPGAGRLLRVFGGPAFAHGMRRAVVASTLWVSAWQDQGGQCGPSCWVQAVTYQIDLETGRILQTYRGTYLVSAGSDGIWVATGSLVLLLDSSTGATLATTPWLGTGEPRIGCEYLWSYRRDAKQVDLALLDRSSGDAIGSTTLSRDFTFGPVWADGQCWLMSGSGGASAGTTKVAWLMPGGGLYAERTFEQSLVVLDREFWVYNSDGSVERFEPSAGVPYGVKYKLDVRPQGGDPKWFFAATGTLWMLSGDDLVGFDIRTGTSAVRG